MQYELVKIHVESELQGLSKLLTYHNESHTLGDVLPAVVRLSNGMGINGNDLIILKTAALFHDMGYLKQYNDNECIGSKMAEECLLKYDYSKLQIKQVKVLILSTKMPQSPKTLLEKIICDADLDSLGRKDFLELSMCLFTELNNNGYNINKKDWTDKQILFLESHKYLTSYAKKTRDCIKQENINFLKSL